MIWFLLTLSCIILWGTTDILLKKSLHHSDTLSQYKTFIWMGLVMTLAGVVMAICSNTLPQSIKMVGISYPPMRVLRNSVVFWAFGNKAS